MTESVSIALAVYNGEKYLPELLNSLNNQTLTPLELVVLDDCSSDNSIQIIKSFPSNFEKRIFYNEKNMGPVYTFKKLAGLCNGKFIAFCDQDDVWIPKKLEWSFTKIKKLNDNIPTIVFTDLSLINEESELIENSFWKIRKLVQPEKFDFGDILCANIVTGCTTLINQSMKTELEKMPLNVIMHDWWMALIAFSFGQYSFIHEPTVLYRSHTSSVTSKHKTTFFTVFLEEYKKKETYLNENIEQAVEFRKLYQNKLTDKNKRMIDKFIKLKNKGFILKRFFRDGRSLLRRLK